MRVPVLQRAIDHALACVESVSPASLSLPTPCAEWDLRMLLDHSGDAFDVLDESVLAGIIAPASRPHRDDPAAAFRDRAERFLRGSPWTGTAGRTTAVGDRRLPTEAVLLTVALEIAVHGWDIARACGDQKAIPHSLALDLLPLAPLLVHDAARPALFGAPVAVPGDAPPGDRLVAFLGRDPAAWR
ncbi:TIGR03086 family metal-binding protein [Actinomadura nitritigenes]|uniref:TIGR03086 family metal-binding protein n=1 Tax=Actinomadura nitritigenes TaxID=134602 RepID=UPI003D931908